MKRLLATLLFASLATGVQAVDIDIQGIGFITQAFLTCNTAGTEVQLEFIDKDVHLAVLAFDRLVNNGSIPVEDVLAFSAGREQFNDLTVPRDIIGVKDVTDLACVSVGATLPQVFRFRNDQPTPTPIDRFIESLTNPAP